MEYYFWDINPTHPLKTTYFWIFFDSLFYPNMSKNLPRLTPKRRRNKQKMPKKKCNNKNMLKEPKIVKKIVKIMSTIESSRTFVLGI